MGGIYETWVNKETAEIWNTFSIITVEANPLMAKIHNIKKRMPFILSVENEKKWIDPDLSKEKIAAMILPFSEDGMEAWSISKRITDRHQNSNVQEVMEHHDYPELGML